MICLCSGSLESYTLDQGPSATLLILTKSLVSKFLVDSNTKSIQFKDKNTYYSLNLDKIVYIVTDKNNRQTIIKYENNIYKISKSLTEIIDMLDSRFIRTHRCCYINKDRLEYIDLTNNIIKFDNGITIPYLSRRFKKYF